MLILLFMPLFYASGQQADNQQDRVLFRGIIVSANAQEKLPGAQIVINRLVAGASSSDGTFSFFARKNDTVIFTMMGYRPLSLVVSDTLKAKEFVTGIFMQADTLEIGEVVIIPRFSNLKTDIINSVLESNSKMDNARNNISIASYQGRTGQGKLGDPGINYEVLRQQQKIDAYEKGGIPSDKIMGISPLMLLPAAYLLLNGLPEAPAPPEPHITQKDLDELNQLYFERIKH